MKTIVIFFVALISIFINCYSTEPTACTWDACSPSEDWNVEPFPILGDTNSCSFLVYYKWRECTNRTPSKQIEIIKIEMIDGANCDNTSDGAIMYQSVVTILASSAGIFGMGAGTLDVSLKIPACVKRSAYDILSNVDCYTTCCQRDYELEYLLGEMKVTSQSDPTSAECGGAIGGNCSSYCSSMTMPLNTPLIPVHFSSVLCDEANCIRGPIDNVAVRCTTYTDVSKTYIVYYLSARCNSAISPEPKYFLQVVHITVLRYTGGGNWLDYEWLKEAYKKALYAFKEGEGDNNGFFNQDNSSRYVRVMVKPCWKSLYADEDQTKYIGLMPCYDECCCYRDIKLQKDISYVQSNPGVPYYCLYYQCTGTCYAASSYPNIVFCRVINEFNENFGLPKISLSEINKEKINSNILFKPNPAKDMVELNIISNFKGSFSVSFFTLTGQIIKSTQLTKNQTDETYQFSASDMQNGSYFYKIQMDKNVYTGFFLINK